MSDQNPLVSVVVPAYNRATLIGIALESVWMQTYRPIELIVVDDGSVDDTHERVLEWTTLHDGKMDFSIRYLHQENQGANAARNLGIRYSQGEFVAFIDSDDRWLPDKLEKQIPLFFNDPEIGGVYCGLGWIDLDNGEYLPDECRSYLEGWLLPNLLVHDVTAGTPCYVIKRACFDKAGFFDINLAARQDWDMWIRLAVEYKISCVHEVLVYAGKHTGARLSSDLQRSIDAHWLIFNKYVLLRKQFPFSVQHAAEGALFRRLGRIYFHYGLSKRKALAMYLRSILAWPFCFDSYAALAGIILPGELRRKIHIQWNRLFGKTPLAIKSF
jgi:glycosyltransferase involved in cell wall biosynthesis